MCIGTTYAKLVFFFPNLETFLPFFNNKSVDSFMLFFGVALGHYK